MKRTFTFAAALALGVAAFAPLPSMAQSGDRVVIRSAPPSARYESIPAPRAGHVWAPGYWNWDGRRHVWIDGRWVVARDGHDYQRSEWSRDNDGWRLDRGGWRERAESDDRDHDMNRMAPPQPRYERVPRLRPGYVWAPGYWDWRGNRHEWIRGTWLRDRPGFTYEPPHWRQRDGHWYLEQGRWEQPRRYRGRDRDRDGMPDRFERDEDRDRDGVPDRMERRDRDRDGVPDAYDRDRDNDGVRNRNDSDRDGDGYRNDYDRHPDDPRRN